MSNSGNSRIFLTPEESDSLKNNTKLREDMYTDIQNFFDNIIPQDNGEVLFSASIPCSLQMAMGIAIFTFGNQSSIKLKITEDRNNESQKELRYEDRMSRQTATIRKPNSESLNEESYDIISRFYTNEILEDLRSSIESEDSSLPLIRRFDNDINVRFIKGTCEDGEMFYSIDTIAPHSRDFILLSNGDNILIDPSSSEKPENATSERQRHLNAETFLQIISFYGGYLKERIIDDEISELEN